MNTKNSKNNTLAFTALIYAMLLTFSLISNFTGRESEHWRFFYAFTQQSNIIVLVWLVIFGVTSFTCSKWNAIACNNTLIIAITVYISITFFIVALVLTPIYNGTWNPVKSTAELLHHNLTPIIMWYFFFLVDGVGSIQYKKALYILIYPILYVGANLAIGANVTYLDGKPAYAYGFINPNNYPNLFIFALVFVALIVIFTLFGVLLIKIKLNQQNQKT